MVKQHIHVFLDNEIYLLLRMNNVKISPLVNDLLKQYVSNKEFINKDINEIQNKINENNLAREKLNKEIELLSIELVKVKDDKEKEIKQSFEKNKALKKSLSRSGFLDE